MDFIKKHHRLILLLIPIASLALHWYVFGLDLVGIHVWRQTKTQQVINNFYREDMNILHPRCLNMAYHDRLVLMEFPIMQWLFALVHKLTGIESVALSRLLSFITGIASVMGMYRLGKGVFRNVAVATVCAWCFAFSPVFYYYMVNPMPDNFALCFGVWALALFYSHVSTGKMVQLWLSAACLSIAALAKLPFVIFGAAIGIYYLAGLRAETVRMKQVMAAAGIYILLLVAPVVWYASVMDTWGSNEVIAGVTNAQQGGAELVRIFFSILTSMLPELLINYGAVAFFAAGLYAMFRYRVYKRSNFAPLAALGIVVISYFFFEISAITTVHDYYMFPFLPPLFLVVAYGARWMMATGKTARVFAFVCLAALPFTAFIRAWSRWDVATDTGFEAVFYHYRDEIRGLTPKDALCVVGNDGTDMVLLYYIDRKGWCFNNDEIDGDMLSSYMKQGARYLYITGNADAKPGIAERLAEKVYERETLRVYKLKDL